MSIDEDIDYLSGTIASAASGIVEIGMLEGFKVAKAFVSIAAAGRGRELGARFLSKLWNTAPPGSMMRYWVFGHGGIRARDVLFCKQAR